MSRVTGLSYAPDRRRLASCSLDGTLRLWDTDTGDPLLVILAFFNESSVVVTPAGRATCSNQEMERELIYLVQETEGGPIQRLSHAQFRGRYAAALGSDRTGARAAPARPARSNAPAPAPAARSR
jgi:WD40 repeat protein